MEHKLRAVVDTNLFISGLFGKDTLSAELQDLWVHREFELATSIEILREISRVLQYPTIRERFKPREENIRRFFRLIFRKALITKDLYSTDRITDDPSDNIFLACAMEAKADYIVSRDPHLRNLKHFHGVKIIDVKAFVERVRKG
ncbi:MAG: putative toxin-antitoxin system toxin component, PIN family [Nitrospirae bacterium RBG_13_41_22]|nr:MAG: putative toxin-antitoxin system toxin component, PIN family [Nitrospirae bacterium RBG_13_41_22]OHE56547.1 MAG: putative toxin-antitoxin system toxin component, PIN family [Thermodesulfovibrio sp. RBG_19FT_COMBO_42_12]